MNQGSLYQAVRVLRVYLLAILRGEKQHNKSGFIRPYIEAKLRYMKREGWSASDLGCMRMKDDE